MTKQEATTILLEGCTKSNAPTINSMREMLQSADCGQFVPEGAAEFVEVDRAQLLAALNKPKAKTKPDA
jgi:hypothetical protein